MNPNGSEKSGKVKVYHLKPPTFDKSSYLGYNIGIRPARKFGPRLEKECIKDKIFYHNYGHAGYGVAMSWGASKIMTTMFANEFGDKHKQVAILGSGYMGLHTAKQLIDLGYKVTIYTKTMPSEWGVFGASEKKLTSQIAAGLIELCRAVELFQNKQQTELIYEHSLTYIKSCYENQTYPGFYKRDFFYLEKLDRPLNFYPGSCGQSEKCKVTFGNGREFDAFKNWSYHIDGDLYLNALVKELYQKGVAFVAREFKSLDEIMQLNETIVFNCTGFQSKYLFNDTNIFAKKGIMLAFKNTANVDYFLASEFTKKIHGFHWYPMNNRLSIGLTWIYEEDISPDQDQKHRDVLASAVEDFKKLYLEKHPKL